MYDIGYREKWLRNGIFSGGTHKNRNLKKKWAVFEESFSLYPWAWVCRGIVPPIPNRPQHRTSFPITCYIGNRNCCIYSRNKHVISKRRKCWKNSKKGVDIFVRFLYNIKSLSGKHRNERKPQKGKESSRKRSLKKTSKKCWKQNNIGYNK